MAFASHGEEHFHITAGKKESQGSSPRAPHPPEPLLGGCPWGILGSNHQRSSREKELGRFHRDAHPTGQHLGRAGAERVQARGGGKTTIRALLSNVAFSHRLGSVSSQVCSKLKIL